MTTIETLLRASLEMAKLRQENRILRTENARLRAQAEHIDFDLSADDVPALLRKQI